MTSFKKTLCLTALLCLAASVATAAEDNTSPWTRQQLEKNCYGKAKGSDTSFERCMSNSERKIGKKKKPGEALALDNIDSHFKKKATKKPSTQTKKIDNGKPREQNKPKIF